MPDNSVRSVIFITGAFISNDCWNEWRIYFEDRGYKCIAPCWPYKEGTPEELRNRHPDPSNASNRFADVVDYFVIIAKTFEEKPILVGHSLGGLIVQLLLQRGLGAAGVAIHSFPPGGVNRFGLSFLKAWWPAMGFFTSVRKTYMISFRRWKRTIADGIDCKQQKELFYKYAIPESKLLIRDVFDSIEKIDFKKDHVPLLLLSGSQDKMIPASLNRANYEKYKTGSSITDYMNFEEHGHLVFDPPIEEAEFVFNWLQKIG